ncbi:DNA-binding MarR family transcriptional regulator [Kineococcus radiotolerans]|uniref:DNA-binding MarR family transcriptional regulator n=1 Tax=Kineococcus radiotolerans TaxID=131568 RepID=A0A7W4TIV0_KINRA|nr:helix-turn-helix domain-containing protein [Kineococcus radiotolerans]MBB2899353.1 DNA-binding MarR family transcriptional regulator [Kineococcus radiotolerans]
MTRRAPQSTNPGRPDASSEGKLPADLAHAEALRTAVGTFVRQVRSRDTMPLGQAAVLGHLARAGNLPITALAELEGVRHQSMARTVALLVEQGLVATSVDERDRRRVSVGLLGEGARRLGEERWQRANAIATATATALTAEERALAERIPEILGKIGGSIA